MPRQNPLSLVRRRPAQRERVIVLTEHESVAVIELGLRPTYALDCRQDVEGDVDLMLANAAAWMRAAEITSAGRAGRIPPELRADIAGTARRSDPRGTGGP